MNPIFYTCIAFMLFCYGMLWRKITSSCSGKEYKKKRGEKKNEKRHEWIFDLKVPPEYFPSFKRNPHRHTHSRRLSSAGCQSNTTARTLETDGPTLFQKWYNPKWRGSLCEALRGKICSMWWYGTAVAIFFFFFPLFSKGEEGSIVDPSNEREGEREDEEKWLEQKQENA